MSYKSKFTGEEIDSLLTEVQDGKGGLDPSGIYPSLTSGFANNLVGRGESVPAEFSFRASGGKSIQDGTARMKVLHGNAVVWNQLRGDMNGSNYGYSVSMNGHKVVFTNVSAITPDYGNIAIIHGWIPIATHKYIILSDTNLDLTINSTNGYVAKKNTITTAPNLIYTSVYFRTDSAPSLAVGESTEFNMQIVDLTLMFGAGNEPLTIEEYEARKPIVADEYAYNEGEVIAFNADAIKSVGDNTWDEEWESGGISEITGEEYDSIYMFRTKGYIRVLPNTQYYFKKPLGIVTYLMFYDEDKNFVKWLDPFATTGDGGVFTTYNAPYMRFICYTATYNNDITISLYHSGWKAEDAKYQPYWEDVRKLDTRILDAFPDGMQKWDKVYNKNGKGYIVKGTGVADLGASSWYNGGVSPNGLIQWKFTRQDINLINVNESITARYSRTDWWDLLDNGKDMSYAAINDSGNTYFCVIDSRYTDAESFKSAMAGVMLYYQLAEPTIIEYDEPFNLDYEVADFGTEEILSDKPSAPLKADIIYQFNAVDMIRDNYNEIQQLKATLTTMQASLASMTREG